MCDRVAVMYLGRIVETGTRDEIFVSGSHPYTRTSTRTTVASPGEEWPSRPEGSRRTCCGHSWLGSLL
jgi:ABC-type dipeptide/oligopeptide/nickel transport system ATPase component